ncbi:tetratricopeptide repeat protein [Sphingobium aquiterrae]|uniref:tetratricopeptide repeat protein n=1 Tax=Sphingobium aquiterrae TaxID=2038656 RepID=UPI00301B5350
MLLPSIAAAWAVAAVAPAGAAVDGPALNAYARARLADVDGAGGVAVSAYRQALAADPASIEIASRSYRQAIESGDMALALQSAHVLDATGPLPRDGALLFAVEALAARNWSGARALAVRLEKEESFGFLAPILLSWISVADGPYAPPQATAGARFGILTQRYIDEHAALQALSRGKAEDAMPAITRALSLRTNPLLGFRMAAARRLAALGQREAALALLDMQDEASVSLSRTRAEIVQARRFVAPPMTPVQGFGRLLARLADDLTGEGSTSAMALTLARLATFADPQNAEFRLGVARQLVARDLDADALTEAGRIPPASPYGPAAADVRVTALAAGGDAQGALALARDLAARPDAGAAEHLRLATLLADANDFEGAAAAYRAAHRFYAEGAAPWTLYLLEGSALERAGRWDEAKAALTSASRLAPDEPVVLNYLGYAQVERGQNVAQALDLLKKASRLRPDDPSITDSLGWAHYMAGDMKAAVPVLERAAAGAPGDVTINEHLGDALWAVGRRYEARYAWRAASIFAEGDAVERLAGKLRDGPPPRKP